MHKARWVLRITRFVHIAQRVTLFARRVVRAVPSERENLDMACQIRCL